jgi:hypothetical protein
LSTDWGNQHLVEAEDPGRNDDGSSLSAQAFISSGRERVWVNLHNRKERFSISEEQLLARMDGTCCPEIHRLAVDDFLYIGLLTHCIQLGLNRPNASPTPQRGESRCRVIPPVPSLARFDVEQFSVALKGQPKISPGQRPGDHRNASVPAL